MGLSTNRTYILLGGRTSVNWQDLTGDDHLGHQRRLDLGPGGSEPSRDACAPTVTQKQQSPWSLKELCELDIVSFRATQYRPSSQGPI